MDRREEGGHVLLTLPGPPESIAFRFDEITFLDSSMLAQLARTLKALGLRDKPTYIITWDPGVVECLRMADLDRLRMVLASEEEYRRELARKPGA